MKDFVVGVSISAKTLGGANKIRDEIAQILEDARDKNEMTHPFDWTVGQVIGIEESE